MKYLDEYRDAKLVGQLLDHIRRITTKPWTIMEVCGGQTHAILRFGLDQLLPAEISLIHGPGCPVCVTPVEIIDKAVELAARPDVIFCSFGDMLRVPGSAKDLLTVKSEGGQVRIVYSPLDAVRLAQKHPDKQVVFFAVGFETTAPANAMAVLLAKQLGLRNFTILSAQVLVPPAMEAILQAPNCRVQGFLAAGHVCTVMGTWQYEPIASKYKVPIVATGFEPTDLLQGIAMCIQQLEAGQATVQIQYKRSVRPEGNTAAIAQIREVFEIVDRKWRGIGLVANSGLALREKYADFDAEKRFRLDHIQTRESPVCIAGEVLQGLKKPLDCPAFGTECTPEHPLGAPMVSSEGACAAYYRYRSRTNSPHSTS